MRNYELKAVVFQFIVPHSAFRVSKDSPVDDQLLLGLPDGNVFAYGGALESRTIAGVGTAGATGTGVTLTSGLTAAHASGAAVQDPGTGITFTPALTSAHAAEYVEAKLLKAEVEASFRSASGLGFDDLIHPEETRNALLSALQRGIYARQAAAEPVSRTLITP